MPKKLSRFKQDILCLLQKSEPDMLRWREITAHMRKTHQPRYKNKKSYEVALSNDLTWLLAHARKLNLDIKKEGDHYGTFNSKIPERKGKSPKLAIWPFLVIGSIYVTFMVLVSSILYIAELDYSLKLLNNTIFNPIRAIPPALIPITLLLVTTLACFLYAFREWVKSPQLRA